jgi:phosphatidylglycerol lysyltransferase
LPIACGAGGVPPRSFALWAAVSAALWATAFSLFGWGAGELTQRLFSDIRHYEIPAIVVIAVLWLTVVALLHVRGSHHPSAPPTQSPALELARGEPPPPHVVDFLRRYGTNTDSFQAQAQYHRRLYFPDIGLVAFARVGRFTIVAGDPVTRPGGVTAATDALHRALRGPIVLISASAPVRDELAAQGWAWLKVGEEPFWDPARWTLDGNAAAKVRHAVNGARRKELRVSETGPAFPTWAEDRRAMEEVGRAWVGSHEVRPLGFMLTLAPFEGAEQRRYFVARDPEGKVVAFLSAVPIYARQGCYFQDVVRRPDAPTGVNELLVHEAMVAMRQAGVRLVTLGAAPLAGLEKERPQLRWLDRALRFAYEHLDDFYHFRSLSTYKAKYAPHWWEPKYIVFRPRRMRARLFYAILKAYDERGVTSLVLWKLAKAIRQEVALDPESGRPRVVDHALRLPGLLLEQDLVVAGAIALGIGTTVGIVADHLHRSFDDVYVATAASIIAAQLTVAVLRARDRYQGQT